MIQLTRLNNHALIVNCDLIKFVESSPDTVLTLVSGEKIVVRETPHEVLQEIIRYRRVVLNVEAAMNEQPQPCVESEGRVEGARLPIDPDAERGSSRG